MNSVKFNKKIVEKLTAIGLSAALVLAGGGTLAYFEGKSNSSYLDPVDIWTVCYGSTKGVEKGDYKTDDECLMLLAEDLVEHDKKMLRYVHVNLLDHQHAAFLSFTYNVGVGAFSKSTMLKKLNKGDYTGACNELSKWVYAGGKKLNGLVRRREAERQICLGNLPKE